MGLEPTQNQHTSASGREGILIPSYDLPRHRQEVTGRINAWGTRPNSKVSL